MKSDFRLRLRLQLLKEYNNMKIDRHNYEEFFILYWDNELSASQKQAVEVFVKQNPDLQEEFNLLGDARFIPDNNIQLREKDFFVNNSFINVTNYEEQLLNYIDDELTTEQNAEVEKVVAKYPNIRKELSLLYKTKLQPEPAVVFPDKSVLYRREEKVRVISMIWFRVAIAAAIILIAGFVTFRLTTTTEGGDNSGIAVNKPADNSITPTTQQTDSIINKRKKDGSNGLAAKSESEKSDVKNPTAKQSQKAAKDNLADAVTIENSNKNNLPREGNRNQNIAGTNPGTEEIASVNIPLEKKNDKANGIYASISDPNVTLKDRQTSDVDTPDIQGKDGGGLKEFLRKTTRVFERRTKIQTTTEDNKLLVGAFAVSLK